MPRGGRLRGMGAWTATSDARILVLVRHRTMRRSADGASPSPAFLSSAFPGP